ncbi:MAG: BolA family protein, partial [Pseudohongiellaceae bacterium]
MISDRVEIIRNRMQKHLEPEKIEISDDSGRHKGHAGAAGGAGHYSVRIISSRFTNKSALERHRMVYQAVSDLMPAEIHA